MSRSCARQLDDALEKGATLTPDGDTVALEPAIEVAAARRQLATVEVVAPEPRRPIGCQDAVRRPADGILGQPQLRREDADDEVGAVAGCGGDDGAAIEAGER